MKKLSLILFVIFISLFNTKNLNALDGYTTSPGIYVRTGPGTSYENVGIISSSNTYLELVSDELYNQGDPNCSLGWYKINYNGDERYICAVYVSIGEISETHPEYNTSAYEARIYGINISVRSGASTSNPLKTTLMAGTNITVKSEKIPGSGCAEGWYNIEYHNKQTGYVCSKYVNKKSDITASDIEYEKTLKDLGFPDSYIPYLVYLHQKHPNWVFNPVNTNLSWDQVVSGEEGKNYIQTIIDYYRVSDIPKEGNTWFESTSAVNAFYLDPRNFLSEKFIFMFESLNYDYGNDNKEELNLESEQTKRYYNIIKNLFGSSYLSTDEYIYMFIGAGFKYNINPVHLASRVYQEGGAKETYEPITGISDRYYGLYPLYGYYNYYNIGAYADSVTSSPVLRGLAYACGPNCGFDVTYGRPWDTREKAIYGGANYLAAGYIDAGQNTMYFQKFNTSPTYLNGRFPFTHQYQTNVHAPVSESANSYTAYLETNVLDETFYFDIPIYENMPEVVSLPEFTSNENSLKEIKIDDKVITGFDPDILEYTVYVKEENESIKIEATKKDEKSTIKGAGTVLLQNDKTEHILEVTSESGITKTYKLIIQKVIDTTSIEDILNNLSVKVTGEIMNHISPYTMSNTLLQSINKYSPGATVTITSPTGNNVEGDTLLATGQTIKIIAPNGEMKAFTLSITGDTSGDGGVSILDLLQVQKHLLNSTKLTDANLKAADTNADGEVTILDLLRVQRTILKEITL